MMQRIRWACWLLWNAERNSKAIYETSDEHYLAIETIKDQVVAITKELALHYRDIGELRGDMKGGFKLSTRQFRSVGVGRRKIEAGLAKLIEVNCRLMQVEADMIAADDQSRSGSDDPDLVPDPGEIWEDGTGDTRIAKGGK